MYRELQGKNAFRKGTLFRRETRDISVANSNYYVEANKLYGVRKNLTEELFSKLRLDAFLFCNQDTRRVEGIFPPRRSYLHALKYQGGITTTVTYSPSITFAFDATPAGSFLLRG